MDEPSEGRSTSSARGTPAASPPRLSSPFIERWLDCLRQALRLEIEPPFARVRPFLGRAWHICAPLLSYSHLDADEAVVSAQMETGTPRLIRFLAPLSAMARPGSPVVSMLDLGAWRDADDFWQRGLSANLRKKIRRAQKESHTVDVDTSPGVATQFFALFARTMHRHGTPPYPVALFERALAEMDAEVVTVSRAGHPIAAYFVLHDREITLFQWAGFDEGEAVGYASLLGEWAAVRAAFARSARWFDLGRAPLGGPAWRHKQYWHPLLFHATSVPAPAENVYDKYRLAAAVWKKLPHRIATGLGPRIIRHLPDA